MNFISEFFSDTFIYALGWTLLHSLWHGAVVSILTLTLLLFLRNQDSNVRYKVTFFSMLSIILLSTWTFISYYSFYSSLFASNGAELSINSNVTQFNNFDAIWLNLFPDQLIGKMSYFTIHMPIIFTVWFFTILFLSVKYLGGYAYSQRLKHSSVNHINKYWQEKLSNLSNRLNVKQTVMLLESKLVKVPMVIGYLKPVILLPVGLLTGIPHEQIEAILIHELAHIKRKDYLIKLMQTVVEIVFFFNPFVWWMSSIINKEREHCCDDLAISITKDNISLVRALAGLCELEVKNTGLALTFGKSKNEVIKRMERIMKKNENKNSFSHFTIALVILLTSIIALGAASLKTTDSYVDSESIQDSNMVHKTKVNKDVLIPPPPPQDSKKELSKIKKSMKKIKSAYSSETDPEIKKKYKEKLKQLEWKAKKLSKENKEIKRISKTDWNDQIKQIEKLKKKLSSTEDKETRKKLKKKIEYLEQQKSKTPPPPPKK